MIRNPPSNALTIHGYVFYDADLKSRVFKIGKTTKGTEVRKSQYEKMGHKKIEMQFAFGVWGHTADETFVKNYFKKLWLDGTTEFFWFDPIHDDKQLNDLIIELQNWVRFMQKQPFVAPVHSPKMINDVAYESADLWLPGGNKRTTIRPSLLLPNLSVANNLLLDISINTVKNGVSVKGDYYLLELAAPIYRFFNGDFTDVASDRDANVNIRAPIFYTPGEDGLNQIWKGNILLNPPGSEWDLWARKLLIELDKKNITQAIVVMPTRTSTTEAAFALIKRATAILKLCKRFPNGGPKATASPDAGQELYYFGNNPLLFAEEFAEYGEVCPTFTYLAKIHPELFPFERAARFRRHLKKAS